MPRCFIAITPPAEIRDSVGEWQSRLQQRLAAPHSLHWPRPQQCHLTLRFLGEVPGSRLEPLAHSLRELCTERAPFDLHLATPGVFPDWRHPRVLWLGVDGGLERLRGLQSVVKTRCAPFGDIRKVERFHPHLTLARIREPGSPTCRELKQVLYSVDPIRPIRWTVHSVELIASTMLPAGSRYESLLQARLRFNGRAQPAAPPVPDSSLASIDPRFPPPV